MHPVCGELTTATFQHSPCGDIPTALEVVFGCQGVRPMSVDRLRDSANTRSQQRGSFKGEGYKLIF
ncbi:hypothetical protein [Candidatus Regiella endosymbiont of Tuberolachnus salignus]|uniref:hypothetical protein n=1 Tax=Candidatus Regiella endosymbiont of Tuberolachnus salignus TaxID=3077956 RepID=UPI0030CE88B3